jgi:hypothetical protein
MQHFFAKLEAQPVKFKPMNTRKIDLSWAGSSTAHYDRSYIPLDTAARPGVSCSAGVGKSIYSIYFSNICNDRSEVMPCA